MSGQKGPWAIHQRPLHAYDDEHIRANGSLRTLEGADWSEVELVAHPVQFDETPPALLRAPETGEHTKQVLLELGLTWEELADLKGKER